ncbi:hypothetical protein BT69DRAFT_1346821 [Atractiella rhizophila]|nr:hypothetical protein BT69DRAFT_1346821 [Atractiella rhizophila]
MAFSVQRQKLAAKVILGLIGLMGIKWIFMDSSTSTPPGEIAHAGVLERITLGTPLVGEILDTRRYPFLQSRLGRDDWPDHPELFSLDMKAGMVDFWNRFQHPFATNSESLHLDEQVVKASLEELLSFNGWASAACSSLTRPFGMSKREDDYGDLTKGMSLYYFAMVVHSADHFLIDQLATVVQMAKRLGPAHIFVSIVDYASTDSVPFLCDLTEAVLTLLGVPFRIRRVPPMTHDPTASYYALEEAYTRNLALEPLMELQERRKVTFKQVVWLKGFTCPNDILETLRIGTVNKAAMVCGMDWKEHNSFFIFNDRWRTRDMEGNLFRGSKSTSPDEEAPPRDSVSSSRYSQHLPFQVFCCESGTHIVDPSQTYYQNIFYHSSVSSVFNVSAASDGKTPKWTEGPCMDSSQMHFCRDIWLNQAREGVKELERKASQLERSGKPRGLGQEIEDLIPGVLNSYKPPTANTPKEFTNSGDYVNVEDGFDTETEPVDTAPEEDLEDKNAAPAVEEPVLEEATQEHMVKVDEVVEDDLSQTDEGQQERPGGPAGENEVKGEAADALAAEKAAVKAEEKVGGAAPGKKVPLQRPNQPGAKEKEKRSIQVVGNEEAKELKKRAREASNDEFQVAKILINPRCVTTYAGVSHTELARDLFGSGEDVEPSKEEGGRYVLDEWRHAPETFVCQEMRTTGGRIAPKQQRRTGFPIAKFLKEAWRPQPPLS